MKDKKELNQLYKDCVDFWGIERQVRMLQEECGELIVALSHFLRKRVDAEEELAEELADVYLMSNQIVHYLGHDKVNRFIDLKSDRVKRKLEEYKEKANG